MADAFIGEIRAFAFDYPPQGWAFCNGTRASVTQNQALFAVITNNFGPTDGQTYFTLPNMQGQAPMHWGSANTASGSVVTTIGETVGAATVALTAAQMPNHTHQANSAVPPRPIPANMMTSAPTATSYLSPPRALAANTVYDDWSTITTPPTATMAPNMISPAGGGQAHNNMSPYLALNFCICLEGEFPLRPS